MTKPRSAANAATGFGKDFDLDNEGVAAYETQQAVNLLVVEREFLAASVAVWREIDKHIDRDGHYIAGVPSTLAKDSDLRRAELEAWRRYRAALDVSQAAIHEETGDAA